MVARNVGFAGAGTGACTGAGAGAGDWCAGGATGTTRDVESGAASFPIGPGGRGRFGGTWNGPLGAGTWNAPLGGGGK